MSKPVRMVRARFSVACCLCLDGVGGQPLWVQMASTKCVIWSFDRRWARSVSLIILISRC